MRKIQIRYSLKSLFRGKNHAIAGITGFAIALSCSLMIMIYIVNELSYDSYHDNAGSIYRVVSKVDPQYAYMGSDIFISTPGALRDALIDDVPGIEQSTKFYTSSHTVECDGNLFREGGFLYSDAAFLEIFNFPLITGDKEKAFREPYAILITESIAHKYYGDDNPVGKTIKIDNRHIYTVVGVLEDIPENSHFRFNFLTGLETYLRVRRSAENKINSWSDFDFYTYVRLSDNVTQEEIDKRLDYLISRYIDRENDSVFEGMKWILQPLKGIHLGGNANFEVGKNSNTKILWILASAGFLIILIATLNYLNLSTAQLMSRSKEAGILKICGSGRRELIIQLLGETVMLAFAGVLLAMFIAWLVLPFFAEFTGRNLVYSMVFKPQMLIMIIILVVVIGITSGIFTAIKLASGKPLTLLMEDGPVAILGRNKPGAIRRTIVVLQYMISITALIIVMTILVQLNFIKKSDLGFTKDNIISIFIADPAVKKNPDGLLSELRKISGVVDVTVSSHLPCDINASSIGFWEGKQDDNKDIVYNMGVDEHFIDFYNMEIVKGRGFSSGFGSDSHESLIINETAASLTGWADPIGMKYGLSGRYYGTVIGVVKDFNFQKLSLPLEPLVIFPVGSSEYEYPDIISVKVSPGTMDLTLQSVKKTLNRLSPGYINGISIMSDRIERMYRDDVMLSGIAIFSTAIAMLLTFFGQYALSFFETRRRTREIVIRKVNGATPVRIVKLFTKELLFQVSIAFIIACPITYYLITSWLKNFAYRINTGPGLFIFPALIIFSVSFIVICARLIKVSKINPAAGLHER